MNLKLKLLNTTPFVVLSLLIFSYRKEKNRNETSEMQVAAGYEHTLVLKTDKTVWATGYNNGEEELGDGTFANRNYPVKITDNVINNLSR